MFFQPFARHLTICFASLVVLACSPVLSAGTMARLYTAFGAVDIEFYDTEKPLTVANFLNYIESGRYDDSFIHRLVPGFVVQGGGFQVVADSVDYIPTDPPVPNEYSSGTTYSNVYGTIAMAKLGGDPDSATSQWFLNLGDNGANLDNQNGGFTVFGHVVAGWNVLQAFNTLFNDSNTSENLIVNAGSPFDTLPVAKLDNGQILLSDLFYTPWALFADGIPGGENLAVSGQAGRDFLVRNDYDQVISGTVKDKPSAGSLTFEDGSALVLSNAVTVTSGNLRTFGSAEVRAEGRKGVLTVPKNQNFIVDGPGELRLSAVLSGQKSTALVKNESGLLILDQANKFGGGTFLNSGTLRLENPGALGTGGLTLNGGVLDLGGQSITLKTFSGSGAITTSLNGAVLTLDHAAAIDYRGTLSGAMTLVKAGKGVLALRGDNAFTGGVVLRRGVLQLGSDSALGMGALTFQSPAVLEAIGGPRSLAGNNPQFWNANWTFTGSHALNMGTGAVLLKKTPTVTVASAPLTVGGVVAGETDRSGLVKSGTGVLILKGANTYAGPTTVKGGVLELAEGGSLQSAKISLAKKTVLHLRQDTDWETPALITGAGLILQEGTATVTLAGANSHKGGTEIRSGILAAGHLKSLGGGDVILRSGGTLALGLSNHQAAIAGNLLWEDGATISLVLNPDPVTSDWVSVAKGFSNLQNAPLSFEFEAAEDWTGQSFRVLYAAKGFGALTADDFVSLNASGFFEIRPAAKKGQELWFTYAGSPGFGLQSLTAVPEPSAAALMALAGAVVFFGARARRRHNLREPEPPTSLS